MAGGHRRFGTKFVDFAMNLESISSISSKDGRGAVTEALPVVRPAVGPRAVVSAAEGEEFRTLFDAVAPALTGYCVSLVGDVELAHDVTQEAFVRLLSRWRDVRSPRAYLYLIAVNLVREHWRRAKYEQRAFAAVAGKPAAASAHDPWLWDLVTRLPPRLRTVVLLHYYADLPVADVARVLRLPSGTVKQRLHRARGLLQVAIEDVR